MEFSLDETQRATSAASARWRMGKKERIVRIKGNIHKKRRVCFLLWLVNAPFSAREFSCFSPFDEYVSHRWSCEKSWMNVEGWWWYFYYGNSLHRWVSVVTRVSHLQKITLKPSRELSLMTKKTSTKKEEEVIASHMSKLMGKYFFSGLRVSDAATQREEEVRSWEGIWDCFFFLLCLFWLHSRIAQEGSRNDSTVRLVTDNFLNFSSWENLFFGAEWRRRIPTKIDLIVRSLDDSVCPVWCGDEMQSKVMSVEVHTAWEQSIADVGHQRSTHWRVKNFCWDEREIYWNLPKIFPIEPMIGLQSTDERRGNNKENQ